MNTDDYEQPVGERPELDLSYTHRDGRHVPIKLVGPTREEFDEWRRREAALLCGSSWPDAEYVLAAQDHARQALADIDALAQAEAASFTEAFMQRHRPKTRDLVLLVLSLWALLAVLTFVIGHAVGVL